MDVIHGAPTCKVSTDRPCRIVETIVLNAHYCPDSPALTKWPLNTAGYVTPLLPRVCVCVCVTVCRADILG